MRLLILTQYYPPETGAPQNRLSDLAKRLSGRGHQVEVLTALPNYPQDEIFPSYQGKDNMAEQVGGIRVCRVGIYVPKQKTFWKRIAHYLSFVLNAILHGEKLIKQKPDVIFMESPPLFVAFAGIYLAGKLKAKLVANVSDLWPESAIQMGILKSGFGIALSKKLEQFMYRRADLITGQTDGITQNIKSRFPHKKVLLFPNGVDISLYGNVRNGGAVRASYGWQPELFVVGYAGVLGHAQKLGQVLDAAKLSTDLPGVHFGFWGDGPCKAYLEERIRAEKIMNARVYPSLSIEKMPELYAALNAGCVPLAKEKIFHGARPSKMFEIMAAGLPVLLCAKGEAAVILNGAEEGPAGVAVEPEHPAALADAVRKLATHKEESRRIGERGRRYVAEYFNRETIAKDLEEHLLELLK